MKTRTNGTNGRWIGRETMAAALATGLASLGTSIANIALPATAEAFAATFPEVQRVVVAYLATMTIFVLIAGRLGDRHGVRRMLIAGLSLFAATAGAASLAPSLAALVGARAIQGVGAAFAMTLSLVLARQAAPADRLGRTMGLLGTVSAIGTALGPSLGGFLVATAGWRAVFVVQVPIALAALALVATLPKDEPSRSATVAGRARFTLAAPLSSLAANVLVAAVMMATLVVGPYFLARGLGLGEGAAGLVMAVGPMISIAGGVPAGRAVDAVGAGRILRLGLAMLAIGAFGLAVLPIRFGVAGQIAAIAVLTPGYQLFQAANNTAVLAAVPADRRGAASGWLGLARNVGLILGASVAGLIFAGAAGAEDPARALPSAIASGMQATFVTCGAAMVAAIAIIAVAGARRPRGDGDTEHR